jgi:hypothetical protein
MTPKELLKSLIPNSILEFRKKHFNYQGTDKYAFDKKLDVKKDIKQKYQYQGELLDIFAENKGNIVHKWHHYIPLYDRYFSPYRGKKIKFLEIGVSNGGSLQMWRKYFGDSAIIFGIDINPECKKYNGLAGQVRIGSQVDMSFVNGVIEEMGGIDIVLDDGSHQMEHISATLQHLFPLLNIGGLYMIEDLHTSYWKSYGGKYGSKKNFFTLAMDLVNDMHYWYHNKKRKYPFISSACSGIHIHDSITVLEKNDVHRPSHSVIA